MSGTDNPRLLGVLVTFHRVAELATALERLGAQTRTLDHLLVIDNGSDLEVKKLVEARPEPTTYVDAGDNLGPAGGFALGMEQLIGEANEDDWIFLLDDDDPPDSDQTLERAGRFAVEMLANDVAVGCVGVSGGRFDLASGRVLRIADEELTGPVPADHVTGGGQP
ncbi:MAG: glycosyltransferase, partial [Acidimicrobiia bacterium]